MISFWLLVAAAVCLVLCLASGLACRWLIRRSHDFSPLMTIWGRALPFFVVNRLAALALPVLLVASGIAKLCGH